MSVARLGMGLAHEALAEQVPSGAVRQALARLRTARLVLDIGPGWVLSERGVRRRVFRRRVFGVLAPTEGVEPAAVLVPTVTTEWLAHAHAWGGPRLGAGRPAKNSSPVVRIQDGGSRGEFKTGGISMREEKSNRVTDRTDSSPTGKKGGEAPQLSLLSPEGDVLLDAVPLTSRAPTWGLSTAGVPPYPGVSLVHPAQVPSAPTLRADASWEDHLRWLALAYEGACAAVWGDAAAHTPKRGKSAGVRRVVRPTAMVGSPASPRWDKIRDVCRAAADALQAAALPPAAWALFSATRWRGMREHEDGERTGRVAPFPPVAWFWSAKRIVEDAETARSYARGGARVPSAAYSDLLRRYDAMRRDLARGVPAAQTMERNNLMPAEYDRIVTEVRREAEEQRKLLRTRALRGEWLGW